MKLRSFLTFKAVISCIFGILFLLVPAWSMSIFGVSLGAEGVLMTRFFGVGMLAMGLICAFHRTQDRRSLTEILLALFIADTIGFIVALSGQLAGLLNPVGWIIVLLWLFFAAGLGYFRFGK